MDKPTATDRNTLQETGLELLHLQTRELDALISVLAPEEPAIGPNDETRVLVMMLQALGVSLHSVGKLTAVRDMAIRDCFGIARTAAETAVNVAFIAISGPPMAEKAVRHMRQKRWRDLHRTARIAGKELSISRDIGAEASDFPGLQEALDEYTNKKGAEVRDWTSETIEDRIAAVDEQAGQAGKLLSAAIFTIYRPSSEILHGTFYGVNYFWQGSRDTPATTRRDFEELWTFEHFVTLFSTLMFATSGAIQAVASIHDLAEFQLRQDRLIGLVGNWAERAKTSDPDGDALGSTPSENPTNPPSA